MMPPFDIDYRSSIAAARRERLIDEAVRNVWNLSYIQKEWMCSVDSEGVGGIHWTYIFSRVRSEYLDLVMG